MNKQAQGLLFCDLLFRANTTETEKRPKAKDKHRYGFNDAWVNDYPWLETTSDRSETAVEKWAELRNRKISAVSTRPE